MTTLPIIKPGKTICELITFEVIVGFPNKESLDKILKGRNMPN